MKWGGWGGRLWNIRYNYTKGTSYLHNSRTVFRNEERYELQCKNFDVESSNMQSERVISKCRLTIQKHVVSIGLHL
jgi:hypothetical protein